MKSANWNDVSDTDNVGNRSTAIDDVRTTDSDDDVSQTVWPRPTDARTTPHSGPLYARVPRQAMTHTFSRPASVSAFPSSPPGAGRSGTRRPARDRSLPVDGWSGPQFRTDVVDTYRRRCSFSLFETRQRRCEQSLTSYELDLLIYRQSAKLCITKPL